jgi:hypothetical protein
MAARKTNWAKCKVWTPTLTMELEGPRVGCVVELFRFLSCDQRELAIDKINTAHTAHADMLKIEAEKAAAEANNG